jgi:ATP-dependent helicase HrpA
VTVRLTAALAEVVDVGMLEWAVPALREQRLLALLRGLPKSIRRPLMPLDATARRILEEVPVERRDFLGRVARYLLDRHGLEVAGIRWDQDVLPSHLRPRFEVGGFEGGKVLAGRDLKALVGGVREEMSRAQGDVWGEVVRRWEREDLQGWTFGDVEAGIVVGEVGGLPVRAFAGLKVNGGRVDLRLFREEHEAVVATMAGVSRLAELVMGREVIWVQKDLRELRRVQVLYATLGSAEELMESAWEHVRWHLFPPVQWVELRESAFLAYVESARGRISGVVSELVRRVGSVLEQRQEALMCKRPLPGMDALIGRLVPPRFLSVTPWERLPHLPRYLRALVLRAERAAMNPLKDREKAVRVEPYDRMVSELVQKGVGNRAKLVELWWLMEEYRVSVFAQELGTSEKVSPKRLEELAAAVREG